MIHRRREFSDVYRPTRDAGADMARQFVTFPRLPITPTLGLRKVV